MASQILLFNDFGWQGPYLGQMISVLHGADENAVVVPIQTDAPFADPLRSGYLLAALVRQGPEDGVWVAVVDPGVGGPRRPLMVRADNRWLVGPDNGLLVPAINEAKEVSVQEVTWRPEWLSDSFHGRDLFAPVASRLACGKAVTGSACRPEELVGTDRPSDLWEVIYIDGFGNCMTGIRGDQLTEKDVLRIAGSEIAYARTFSEAVPGSSFWYVNSLDLIEIAVNLGDARIELGLAVGAEVVRA